VHLAEAVKKAVGVPVRAVGLIDDAKQAEEIVAGGRADMVAIARALLADPRWPWRAAATLGHEFKTAPQLARAAQMHRHWLAA
jgi:2,4-dienoyl-CoA reductase-like NADH-dependent reductase (Old Yellow Enzyme family)